MLESLLISTGQLSPGKILIHLLLSLLCGLLISLSYIYGNKKAKSSASMAITVVVLPAIVSVVISLVGSDIARAVSLGGVFALVRFRSAPGDSRDIAYVFFTMVTGLAVGIDCYVIAFMMVIVIGGVFLVLPKIGYAAIRKEEKVLKITIPENLDYQGVFDDLFAEYLEKCTLTYVKTINMGTLFLISYDVVMKKNINEKKFIDELRCRNGNLNIMLTCAGKEESPSL